MFPSSSYHAKTARDQRSRFKSEHYGHDRVERAFPGGPPGAQVMLICRTCGGHIGARVLVPK